MSRSTSAHVQAQSLAYPETCGEGQDIQSLKAVPGLAGRAEEYARLLGVEWLYLFLPDLGRVHEGGRVAGDEVSSDRLLQSPAQYGVCIAHARGLEPVAKFGGVEGLHVGGGELRELLSPQGRDDVPSHLRAIVRVRAWGQVPIGRIFEPACNVLPDGHVLVVVDQSIRAVREGLRQLAADLLPLLAVDGLALRSCGVSIA